MNALWNSLPVPALLLNANDTIAESNPAAESFLNLSAKSLKDAPVWDKVMINAPIEDAFARASSNRSSLFVNDVDVSSGERTPLQCNIQFAPLTDGGDQMLMIFEPREMATRLNKNAQSVRAAKSAIGMAEMLAHEIKNPLAGITGAAQLLSITLSNADRELIIVFLTDSRL